MARAVGEGGRVTAVEGDARAVADARRNLHDVPGLTLVHGPVERVLEERARPGAEDGPVAADVVVLDPPRTGARARVVAAVAALRPRAVAYVACDPAALARDTATLQDLGYRLADLVAFDAFPQTHHVECVAQFLPT